MPALAKVKLSVALPEDTVCGVPIWVPPSKNVTVPAAGPVLAIVAVSASCAVVEYTAAPVQVEVVFVTVSAVRVNGEVTPMPPSGKTDVPPEALLDFTVSEPENGPIAVGVAMTGSRQSVVPSGAFVLQVAVPSVKTPEPDVSV